MRFNFTDGVAGSGVPLSTVMGEAVARRWGIGAGGARAGAASAGGLTVGALKEKAEATEGVSEGGLEAKENPVEEPGTKAVGPPREKAEGAGAEEEEGKEKEKPEDDEVEEGAGAGGAMVNGAGAGEAARGGGAADDEGQSGGNAAARADGREVAGWGATEPKNTEKVAFIR